jgi:hypothetical protein
MNDVLSEVIAPNRWVSTAERMPPLWQIYGMAAFSHMAAFSKSRPTDVSSEIDLCCNDAQDFLHRMQEIGRTEGFLNC